jgi:DNA-binding transcriptional regulator YdaS (Cro superfamily)
LTFLNLPRYRRRMDGEQTSRDAALQRAIDAVGGAAELARRIGVKRQAVSAWRRCPTDRARSVQTVTGVPMHELRPDIWRKGEPQ